MELRQSTARVLQTCVQVHAPPVGAQSLPLVFTSAALVFETWFLLQPDVPGHNG